MSEEKKDVSEEMTEDSAKLSEESTEEVTEKAAGTEEKIIAEQGFSPEKYDVEHPLIDGKRVEEDELHGIEIKYDLDGEEVKLALKVFQRKTIYKKNLIYTGILLILAILYIQSVMVKPDYTVGKVLGALCFVVIGFIWYLPARHIKATVQAVELAHDMFTIEICEKGILLNEKDGKYLISYSKPTTKVFELPLVFVICVSQKQMFAVPKRCIPADQLDEVTRLLKEGLKEKYEVINK